MARRDRPLKIIRSKPKTHHSILEELQQKQLDRKKQMPSKSFVKEPKVAPDTTPVDPAPASKKLCIGSIFVDCGKLGEQWLDLQLRYIKATTPDFHHVSLVQNGKISKFFSNNTEVIRPLAPRKARNSQAHVIGLKGLHAHFMKRQEYYDHFLFIDMDAFPIRNNWYDILINQLKKNRIWEIAIVLRCENLETRLHSSILLSDKRGLSHLNWGVQRIGVDLIGKTESDVHLMSHQSARRKNAFVLLRSNQYQIHPLLCGIYYDLFYHHGCGSGRQFNMRSRPYWGHITPQQFDVRKSIDKLMENPNDFIGKLAGWHPDEYPQV